MRVKRYTPGPWLLATVDADPATEGGRTEVTELRAYGGKLQGMARIYSTSEDAHLMKAAPKLLEALEEAEQFIRNGIELGYIRMPDPDTPDSAHETPGRIHAAIAAAYGGDR